MRRVLALLCVTLLPACDKGARPPAGETPGRPEVFTASDGTRFQVEIIAGNLDVPWSLAFAPDGRLFVTERPGRVRIIRGGELLTDPALTLDDVAAEGEAGALGLTLHPAFADNRLVFLAYTARLPSGDKVNRLVRYREVDNRLAERAVLVDNITAAAIHDGARVRFGPDGKLYLTSGDAGIDELGQDLASLNGKILRLNEDGTTPGDNPLASPVFSWGHRNPQGIDWHPVTGDLWSTEHGATGNDELNRIVAGANYGWPTIEGDQTRPDMRSPILFYTPAIAPSGASFYTGTTLAGFRNNLFFAALRGMHIRRVRFDPADPERVLSQEALVEGRFGRIRDVVTGPDGALYFATSNGLGMTTADDDRIGRIIPAR